MSTYVILVNNWSILPLLQQHFTCVTPLHSPESAEREYRMVEILIIKIFIIICVLLWQNILKATKVLF